MIGSKGERNYRPVAVTHHYGLFYPHCGDEFGNVLRHQLIRNHPGVAALAVTAALGNINCIVIRKVARRRCERIHAATVAVDKDKRRPSLAVYAVMHFHLAELHEVIYRRRLNRLGQI